MWTKYKITWLQPTAANQFKLQTTIVETNPRGVGDWLVHNLNSESVLVSIALDN